MKRRYLLATAAVGVLAGCLDDGETGAGSSPEGGENGDSDTGDDTNGEVQTPTVDTPPHEIDPQDYETDGWDDDYLGTQMATEPSLGFSRLEGQPTTHPLNPSEYDYLQEYAVQTATAATAGENLVNLEAESPIDYDDQLLVVVHSGYGSSSRQHRWRRVEETDEGVHLHGYYVTPAVQTEDFVARSSILAIDQPPGVDGDPTVTVSLTVDEETRVTFDGSAERFGLEKD